MADQTFLSQLEQRTQQVKITLANLEAEKIRIENAIGQLQPLVPHYDALVEAERTITEANVPLDPPAPPAQEYSWSAPSAPAEPQSHGWAS